HGRRRHTDSAERRCRVRRPQGPPAAQAARIRAAADSATSTAAAGAAVDPTPGRPLMEKMPYQVELDLMTTQPAATTVATSDWHRGLPTRHGRQVVLRELRASDAASLHALLTAEEVSRFISPPPTTVEGFEKFIEWTLRQRSAGTYACFAVTVRGFDTA